MMRIVSRIRTFSKFFLTLAAAVNVASAPVCAEKRAKDAEQWVIDAQDKRVALLIGNADYDGNSEDLVNPINDVDAVAVKLELMGYSVKVVRNGTFAHIQSQMGEFVEASRGATVSVFFYAGHGLQVLSRDRTALRNQLLPTDYASGGKGEDFKMIDIADFLARVEATGVPTRIWVLDACRNSPGAQVVADAEGQHESFDVDALDRRIATSRILRNPKMRSVQLSRGGETVASSGFSEMASQPGTLVVYAAGTGSVAPDKFGDGSNSPFTTALLKHMSDPDRSIDEVLNSVKSDVVASSAKFAFSQAPVVFNALQQGVFLVSRLPRSEYYTRVQRYLRIAGCYVGSPDGRWGSSSSRGLVAFKTMSKLPIETDKPDMSTLNAMRRYIATASFEFCAALPAPGGDSSNAGGVGRTVPRAGGTQNQIERSRTTTPQKTSPLQPGSPYGGAAGAGVPF